MTTATPSPALPEVLAGPRRRRFAALVANGLAQAGVAVATALLVQHGFERLVLAKTQPTSTTAAAFAGGLAATLLAGAWLAWRAHIDAEALGQGYVHALRLRLFRHLVRLGSGGLGKRSRGALMLPFLGDLTAIRNWVSLGLARLVVAGLAVPLSLVALAVIAPPVALAVGLAVAITLALTLAAGPRLRETTRESRRRRGRLAAQLQDRIAHVGVVEAQGGAGRELRRFRRLSRRLHAALLRRARRIGLLRAVAEGGAGLAGACALAVGALEAAAGRASPGAVVAAMAVAGLLAPRLQQLGRVYEHWSAAAVAREKQSRFLALQPAAGHPRRRRLPPGPGRLALRGLRVSASSAAIDLRVPSGGRIALVGVNGAGKTRLLRQLAGLETPASGRISLDGVDLARCRRTALRRAVALADADLPLLRGSLRGNLIYGAAAPVSEQDLLRVLERVGLDDLPGRLPRGLNTRVSAADDRFSRGERARLVLARALLVRPRLLLLDEVEANLDAAGRQSLLQVLEDFPGTLVYATHDPALATAADRVVTLQPAAGAETQRPPQRPAAALQVVG